MATEIKRVCDICFKKSEDRNFAKGQITLINEKGDYLNLCEVCQECINKVEGCIREEK